MEDPPMECPYCKRPDAAFSPGYYHCDACVQDEAAHLRAEAAAQPVFFAQIAYRWGGGWGTGPTAREALAKARQSVGLTARDARTSPQFVLEFPAGAALTVSEVN